MAAVLVVDDDEPVRLVATGMLETLGCEVTAVASGREALEALDSASFDIVFLDVGMPIMTGDEVFHRIRAHLPEQRIAFITGYAEEDLSELLDHKTWIVDKPFKIDALGKVLANVSAA